MFSERKRPVCGKLCGGQKDHPGILIKKTVKEGILLLGQEYAGDVFPVEHLHDLIKQ